MSDHNTSAPSFDEPLTQQSDSTVEQQQSTQSIPVDSDDEMPDSQSPESTAPKTGAPRLAKMASRAIIEHLKSVLPNANYCCGGSIPISSSEPLTIRFDGAADSPFTAHKIQFPNPASEALEELLKASEPATFGLHGKHVLDETYRKAAALETSKFSTNFHPADYGVVDAVKQVLVPDYGQGVEQERKELWGVKAELYKLNVYSGPSGKFDKHVDTPRGALQFGSLVVCLPCEHEGGALLVSHQQHTTTFDWTHTASSAAEMKWAAFYGDCTHEVQPVTTGHRITLTYNLFIVPDGMGSICTSSPTIDASLYPLHAGVRQMLGENEFLPEGGTLGFFCTHQYAHTTGGKVSYAEYLLPFGLKGVDAMVFHTFDSIGVNVRVRPVMDNNIWEDSDDENEISRIGSKLWGTMVEDICLEEGDRFDFIEQIGWIWPHDETNITWLNGPNSAGWQRALIHAAHGNEPSVGFQLSHAAIIIDIPPRKERLMEIPKTGAAAGSNESQRQG